MLAKVIVAIITASVMGIIAITLPQFVAMAGDMGVLNSAAYVAFVAFVMVKLAPVAVAAIRE